MSRKIYSIDSQRTVRHAAETMARNRIGSLLVAEEGDYIGIITEVDIIRKVVAKGLDPDTTPVRTVMSAPLVTIEADQPIVDANDLMERKQIRHLGVTRNGKVIGMVSIRDFLHPLNLGESEIERRASNF